MSNSAGKHIAHSFGQSHPGSGFALRLADFSQPLLGTNSCKMTPSICDASGIMAESAAALTCCHLSAPRTVTSEKVAVPSNISTEEKPW